MKSPLEILQQYFGYDSFRLEQANAIENVIAKKNTFVLMPTGAGILFLRVFTAFSLLNFPAEFSKSSKSISIYNSERW